MTVPFVYSIFMTMTFALAEVFLLWSCDEVTKSEKFIFQTCRTGKKNIPFFAELRHNVQLHNVLRQGVLL